MKPYSLLDEIANYQLQRIRNFFLSVTIVFALSLGTLMFGLWVAQKWGFIG